MWARLKARPKILQSWLEEVRQEVATEAAGAAGEPSTTGCEESDEDDSSLVAGFAQAKVRAQYVPFIPEAYS